MSEKVNNLFKLASLDVEDCTKACELTMEIKKIACKLDELAPEGSDKNKALDYLQLAAMFFHASLISSDKYKDIFDTKENKNERDPA